MPLHFRTRFLNDLLKVIQFPENVRHRCLITLMRLLGIIIGLLLLFLVLLDLRIDTSSPMKIIVLIIQSFILCYL